MRTKFSPKVTGTTSLSDTIIRMEGPTSMYKSLDGHYKVWHKGKMILLTTDRVAANAEFERRVAE